MIKSLYSRFRHWSEKGAVYLVSDTHFRDPDRKHMGYYISDEDQFYFLAETCHKNDTLIHLGDVGDLSYIKRLKCYKVLIMGNHDQGVTNFQRKETEINLDDYNIEEVEQMVKKGEINHATMNFHTPFIRGYKSNNLFDEVYTGPLWISKKIVLSHEPVWISTAEDITDNPIVFNIHGHDHSGKEISQYHFNIVPNKRGYAPWNLNQIIKAGFLKDIKDIHTLTKEDAIARKENKQWNDDILKEWYIDTGVENV